MNKNITEKIKQRLKEATIAIAKLEEQNNLWEAIETRPIILNIIISYFGCTNNIFVNCTLYQT